MKRIYLLLPALLLLASCEGRQFFYSNDDAGRPSYAQGGAGDVATGKSRAPLDVPPELQAELELPMGGEVASRADEKVLAKEYQESVAGRAIALDARIYSVRADQVFSAVVDAMTSLNVPVHSVDSPSGIVTSDWIRKGQNSVMGSMFGTDDVPTRHRYIVRVYRAKLKGGEATKLEVRVHGQAAINRRWVNKPMKMKVAEQLFVAVDEQLQRVQKGITGEKTGDSQP